MSYTMCSRVTFPKTDRRSELVLYLLSTCSIQSSWKMLTDTAEIVIPRKIKAFGGKKLKDVFLPGDPVTIELGYNGDMIREFSGYILSVSRGVPVIIKMEDEMYKLKRKTVSYSRKSVTLSTMLSDILPEYKVNTVYGETELGAVRYSNVLVSSILEDLKKKTGLYSYFIDGILHVGNALTMSDTEEVYIHLERNAVSQNLQETGGDYEVTASAILKGGKKLESTAGTKGAETFRFTVNSKDDKITVKTLAEMAQRIYKQLKRQKYKGGIELFGIPSVVPGMIIRLESDITPEMNGRYYVEKVEKTFSDNATYRQNIELGGQINDD